MITLATVWLFKIMADERFKIGGGIPIGWMWFIAIIADLLFALILSN